MVESSPLKPNFTFWHKSGFLKLVLLLFLSIFWEINRGDDLQPLGDEFNFASTQDRWLPLYEVEGWNANQLERWDFTPSYAPGQMVMIPFTSTWYADLKGVLVYKDISGDFIATARLRITRRPSGALPVEGDTPLQFNSSVPDGAPTRIFSIAGIFLRQPRNITHAAPDPIPVGEPIWPPPNEADPGHYITDWTPDGENYLFLSMGACGNAGTWQFEGKSTIDSTSSLYFNNFGVPADDEDAQYVTFQLVKVGNTAVTLRRHAEEPWIVENRYTLADPDVNQRLAPFGNNLQIGIATYTDWQTVLDEGYYISNSDHGPQFYHNYSVITNGQPDLIAMVDYFRLRRPPAELTEALLATLPITYPGPVPASLSGSGGEAYLGDMAHTPLGLLSAPSFTNGNEADEVIEVPISLAVGASNAFSIEYSTIAGGSASTNDYTPITGTLTWAANQTNTQTIVVPVVNDGLTEGIENIVLHLSQPDGPVMLPGGVLELDIPLYLDDAPVAPTMTNEIFLSAVPASTAVNEPIVLQNYVQFTNVMVSNLVVYTNGSEYATIAVGAPGLYTTNLTLSSAGSLIVQTLSLGSPLNATSAPVTITFTNVVVDPPPPPPSTNTNSVVELSLLGLRKQVVRAYPSQTGTLLREIAFPQKTFGKIVAVNDFTGDGTNDFISVKGKSGHLFVATGTSFVEEAFLLPLERGRRIIGSGDVTEDGKAEVFTLGKKQLYIHDFPTFGIVGALTDFRFSSVMVKGQQSSQLLLFKAKSSFKQETIPLGVTNAIVAGALSSLPTGYKVVAPVGDGSIIVKKNRLQTLFTIGGPDFSIVRYTNYLAFPGGKVVGPR